MHSSGWCLTFLFLKNDRIIETNCRMSLTNVSDSQAIYLDQGNWAVATVEPDQMEISCHSHRHVITIEPPLTLVNLQSACSPFSAKIRLPSYFKKYSKGFATAIKTANLHSDKLDHVDFHIWKSCNVSSLSTIPKSNLKKLDSAPSVPVNELKAKIESLKMLNLDPKGKSWFYILGRGTGSGVLLLVIVMMCVYWKYRKHARKEARSTSLNITCTDPENLNMLHTRKGATRSFDVTDLGWEAVRIQGSDRPIKKVNFDDQLQGFEPPDIIDQLEKLGIDVSAHCRSLRARHLALLSNRYEPQD